MNSKLFCVFIGVFKLIAHQCGIFVRKPPLLFAFLSVVIFPCTFQIALAQQSSNVESMNESVVLRDKPALKDGVGVCVATSSIKRSNVSGKNINELPEDSRLGVSSLYSEGNKSRNEGGKQDHHLSRDGNEHLMDLVQAFLLGLLIGWPAIWAAYQGPRYKPNV